MVKNESRVIKRCLDGCRDFCKGFCFLDTGSTDNTVELLTDFLKTHKGCLVQEPFIDFGTSRTRSFQVCKDYALSKNYNLKEWYGLLLDADMVLRINQTSLTLPKDVTTLNILQRAGELEYYNTRLIRLDRDWKSVGVTHEFWSCPDPVVYNIPKEIVYIEDVNDGGCKSDKFERDIRLLENGIRNEPNNVRYYFYLAQSYEPVDRQKAIQYYKKRLSMDGWYEETYITHVRLGDLLEKQEEKIFYWLKAYEVDQGRAEHFYRLSRHYRLSGQNNLSVLFAKMGKQIPYPEDRMLFIENDVYRYRLDEEISIACDYTKEKSTLGFDACNRLSLRRDICINAAHLAFHNLQFYVGRLPASGEKTKWVLHDLEQGFRESSCSILYSPNDTFIGVQRTVNYSMKGAEYICDGPVRTRNFLIKGKFLTIQHHHEIDVRVAKKRVAPVQDLEDLRLVEYKNRYYGIGTTNEYGLNEYPSQVLCVFDKDFIITDIMQLYYKETEIQKNWCPFVYKEKLCCVYGYDPFIVLEINPENGRCTEVVNFHQPVLTLHWRGSSSPVLIGDSYYQVIHTVYHEPHRRYMHRIVRYNPDNLHIVGVTKPFYFESFGIEFCLSLFGKNQENAFIHYSVSDNSSNVIPINLKSIFESSIECREVKKTS